VNLHENLEKPMKFDDFPTQDVPQNGPRQAQDGSKRVSKAFFFDVEFCVQFWTVLGSILDRFGGPFGPQTRSKINPEINQK
jgi:methyltransferase-like protein